MKSVVCRCYTGVMNTTNRIYAMAPDEFHQRVPVQPLAGPEVLHVKVELAQRMGVSAQHIADDAQWIAWLNGQEPWSQSYSIATVYAGHQFGYYVPQLGDGRAHLLAEVHNEFGEYFEVQLKGSGPTPYSRRGDGRAVLRSTLREYLCSEAMAGLNIPTTRSLAIIGSTEPVYRETVETGAVMARVSESFLRFGHLEYAAHSGKTDLLRALVTFVTDAYYPNYTSAQLFEAIVQRTAKLMAHWQAVGFNHGVMNTDNMSLLGVTMDYGPFAFLDNYDPELICNHSDTSGRYAFSQQPAMGQWNCSALASAFSSVVDSDDLTAALATYAPIFMKHYVGLMCVKLGVLAWVDDVTDTMAEPTSSERQLLAGLLTGLAKQPVDYTRFFRVLAESEQAGQANALSELFVKKVCPDWLNEWLPRYHQVLRDVGVNESLRMKRQCAENPAYILRNHHAQTLIEAFEKKEPDAKKQLAEYMTILKSPFERHHSDWAKQVEMPPPTDMRPLVISCSS